MSKLVKNSLLYLSATLFLKGSKFFLLPLYTRLVSPEEYGVVYLIGTLGTFLSMFFSLSVRGAVSRFYFDNKEPEALKEMYSSIVIFIFGFATISYLVIFAFAKPLAHFMNIGSPIYLMLGLFGSYVTVFYPIILALLYIQEKGKLISVMSMITGLFSIVMHLVIIINMQDKVMAFMICSVINGLMQFSIFIGFSRKYLILNPQFKNMKEYLTYSLHNLPSNIAAWITTFSDRLMISKIKGNYETGLYSTGYKIGQFPNILFHNINKAYVPNIYRKYANFTGENKAKTIEIVSVLFALFTGTVFIFIIFSKEFVLLLDSRYQNSLWIIVIILMSYLLSGYHLIFGPPVMFNKKYVKYRSVIWICAAIINIVFNIFLIPIYSIYGAAIATLASYLLATTSTIILANKAIKINYPVFKFVKIILLSLCYFTIFFLDFSWIILAYKFFF